MAWALWHTAGYGLTEFPWDARQQHKPVFRASGVCDEIMMYNASHDKHLAYTILQHAFASFYLSLFLQYFINCTFSIPSTNF